MEKDKEEGTSSTDESEVKENVNKCSDPGNSQSSSCMDASTSSFLPSSSAPPAESLPSSSEIPQFYFQGEPFPSNEMREECLAKIDDCFRDHPDGLRKHEFRPVTKSVCGLPSFFSSALFNKIDSQAPATGKITRDQFVDYWIGGNMLTKDATTLIFIVLKQPNQDYITQDDLLPVLREVVDSHPALVFMRGADDRENYAQTVLYRLFYHMNRYESGLLSLRDLKRGKINDIMQQVDEEQDIDEVRRCFSYEHYLVIYNSFMDLDTDADLSLSRDDIRKYGRHCLTETIVGRIFSEAPRRLNSGCEGMMCYEDFIYFMLSVEDTSSEPAIAYWFKCIDLDCNGKLTKDEFWYFYPEQRQRMEIMQGVIPSSFDSMVTQINDMVSPKNNGYITLRDMKACRLAGRVFDMLFNLPRFVFSEIKREPASALQDNDIRRLTEWDLFAEREYLRLCVDEEGRDDSDDSMVEGTATSSGA